MAEGLVVSFMYLVVICLYICVHEPHMSSALLTDGHTAVGKKMCEDLPSICPCNAHHLHVTAGNAALVCGASQTMASMATLPTIKPPTGVKLDKVIALVLIKVKCGVYAYADYPFIAFMIRSVEPQIPRVGLILVVIFLPGSGSD